jgi:internalin A
MNLSYHAALAGLYECHVLYSWAVNANIRGSSVFDDSCMRVQGGSKVLDFIKKIGVAYSTAHLDLSHLGLKSVPSAVLRLVTLHHLSLSHNPLTSLPPSIVRLTALKSLTLEDTRVRSLPVELPIMYELRTLKIDTPSMLFPPSSVCAEGLQAIFLYLRKISAASVVGTLDLSNTGMKHVPIDIAHAAGITRLDLSSNNISRLPPELSLLSALETLELSGNPLRPHLEDVVSRGLQAIMRYLRSLHTASQTGKLDMRGQQLRFYPDEVDSDWGITYACLDDNLLRHIPRKFGLLTGISELSLRNNMLADLPETLTALNNLRILMLDGNVLQELPAAVCTITALQQVTVAALGAHFRQASECASC